MTKKNLSGLRYSICISGASEINHCVPGAVEKAIEIGREIARQGFVLVTGATTGMPYWSAKGAKEAGGTVIGFSPAASKASHQKPIICRLIITTLFYIPVLVIRGEIFC